MSWLSRNRAPIIAFFVALVVYGAVAGDRLRRRSTDPHFVAQANAWLHGHLEISEWPPGADDPARIEEVQLDDGTVARGRRLTSRQAFRIAGGGEVPLARIKTTLHTYSFNSFPPFPSILLIPQVLIHGQWANDVAFTVVCAAFIPAFFLVLLRRLRSANLLLRPVRDDYWLTGLLTFGTVLFFSSVQGRVWFTAHVVGVVFAIFYVWATIEARHPFLAGLSLGCAFTTRTPMLFMFPLFFLEAWRVARTDGLLDKRLLMKRIVLFSLPLGAMCLGMAWFNYVRFHEFGEFGHSYLVVRQQAQMEQYGLFSIHYLGRNLAVALTLLPTFWRHTPFISIDGHGLAIWLTTPALLLLLWPAARGPWHRPLWFTVACVAVWSLFYQNSGWIQFGYRFSLDYMVLLVILLAVGERKLGRVTKGLILFGVLVNLYGAITFHRFNEIYRSDNAAYDCVVPD